METMPQTEEDDRFVEKSLATAIEINVLDFSILSQELGQSDDNAGEKIKLMRERLDNLNYLLRDLADLHSIKDLRTGR